MTTQRETSGTRGARDVREIERLLDDEERRLTRAIAELRSDDLDDQPDEHDRGDVSWSSNEAAEAASETLAREIGFGLVEEFSRAVEDVRRARHRLETGDYGRCERCGRDVDPQRLHAVPATRWCVGCAALAERESSWPRVREHSA